MRVLFCAVPALGTLSAILLLRHYPLTRAKVESIQEALRERRLQA
jgi:Na+/melibiose symporter-like transporter